MKEMRVRLSMSGHNSTGHVRFKRTVSEREFAAIVEYVLSQNTHPPPLDRTYGENERRVA